MPQLPTTFSILLARARELRQEETDAEALLWKLIRNRQLFNAKFRRQHPSCGYILDFYCHEAKLAIELDGNQHAEPDQAAHDEARTKRLAEEGIRVLRFTNLEVLRNTTGVLSAIAEAMGHSSEEM